jgi:hypothetical protein
MEEIKRITAVILLFLMASCSEDPVHQDDERKFPMVQAPLVCEPSSIDGQGTAVMAKTGPLHAGSVAEFEITFTVGEAGIEPFGFVMLQVSPWWDWSAPQTQYPDGPGYTRVETSFSDPSLEFQALQLNRVIVFSRERGFKPGEKVIFHYGPARVDKYAEGEELFQVLVDADADGHYAGIADPLKVRILPHAPRLLLVDGPSRAAPGEEIRVTAAPVDGLGNWSGLKAGEYVMQVIGAVDARVKASAEEGAGSLAFDFTPPEEGIYFFLVEGPDGLAGRSNVLYCREGSPRLKLFFGDIHGHSRMSDGTGTPEDYYAFARTVSGLDMAALTDHVDYGTLRLEGGYWNRIKKAANEAYDPGRFVTFLGFEWTNWTYGHRNVYYRDGEGPFFRSIDEESDTPQELWDLIEPYEAMTIAHHVGGGPIATDWSIPPGPKEHLVEICSIHGSSEVLSRTRECIYRPMEGHFVRDALNRGYKLGIIGSGDTHDGHPGQRSLGAQVTGIIGVFAEELTREAIWDAMKRRHVYGTSGPKIILFFRVADAPMGSEINWSLDKGGVPIALMAVACDEIESVEIVRNGEVVLRENPDSVITRFLTEDPEPPEGTSWYYARVVQKDGGMAWSSPVWVTR